MIGWVFTAAVLAGGCIQVFSLDPTTQLEPIDDADLDGIADESDNCPDVPNPAQADRDDDGRGDACDTCDACTACAVGPDHDEDGDRVPDGCDRCPTVPDANGANSDGDDLGDACDPDNATQQHRVLFDGFGTITSAWSRIGDWQASGDAAVTVDGGHPFGYRLTNTLPLITELAPWTLEARFEVPADPVENDSIGLAVVTGQGTTQWSCTLLYQTSTWNLTNGIPTPVALSPGFTKLTLSSLVAGSSNHLCRLGTMPEKNNGLSVETYPMGVQLFATRPTRFAYIEVIQ